MASSETAKLRKRMRDLENELDDLRGRGRGRGTDAGRGRGEGRGGRGEGRGGRGEGRGGRGVAAAPAAAVAPAAAHEKKPGLIALPVCLDDIASTPAADLEPTVAAASSSSAAAGNPAESLARHRVRSDESELADSYQATVDEFAVQQLRVLPADHLSSHRDGGVAAKVTAFGLGLGLG